MRVYRHILGLHFLMRIMVLLTAAAPIEHPAVLTKRPTIDRFTTPLATLSITPVHRKSAFSGNAGCAFGALHVRAEHRGSSVNEANGIALREGVNSSERA
jgi:hypothetical protein